MSPIIHRQESISSFNDSLPSLDRNVANAGRKARRTIIRVIGKERDVSREVKNSIKKSLAATRKKGRIFFIRRTKPSKRDENYVTVDDTGRVADDILEPMFSDDADETSEDNQKVVVNDFTGKLDSSDITEDSTAATDSSEETLSEHDSQGEDNDSASFDSHHSEVESDVVPSTGKVEIVLRSKEADDAFKTLSKNVPALLICSSDESDLTAQEINTLDDLNDILEDELKSVKLVRTSTPEQPLSRLLHACHSFEIIHVPESEWMLFRERAIQNIGGRLCRAAGLTAECNSLPQETMRHLKDSVRVSLSTEEASVSKEDQSTKVAVEKVEAELIDEVSLAEHGSLAIDDDARIEEPPPTEAAPVEKVALTEVAPPTEDQPKTNDRSQLEVIPKDTVVEVPLKRNSSPTKALESPTSREKVPQAEETTVRTGKTHKVKEATLIKVRTRSKNTPKKQKKSLVWADNVGGMLCKTYCLSFHESFSTYSDDDSLDSFTILCVDSDSESDSSLDEEWMREYEPEEGLASAE